MKKVLLTLLIGLGFSFALQANPVSPPTIVISELMFDSKNNWIIELELFNFHKNTINGSYSIFITSSTGKIKLEKYTLDLDSNGHGLFVVNNDSLASYLNINPLGDSLQVIFHKKSFGINNSLIFGNYPNAKVRAPKTGESIAWMGGIYSSIFCIDKSPTIGTINTNDGTQGTIYGKVYDKNKQPLLSSYIHVFNDFVDFSPQEDGSYSSQIYALHHRIEKIYYDSAGYRNVGVNISPIDFVMEPDSMMNIDIYLLEDIVKNPESINDLKTNDVSIFKLYPNPIKNGIVNYEIALPVKSAKCYIELLNVNGQKIASYPITQNQGNINLSHTIPNGTYVLNLLINNKNYSSSKVIIAK